MSIVTCAVSRVGVPDPGGRIVPPRALPVEDIRRQRIGHEIKLGACALKCDDGENGRFTFVETSYAMGCTLLDADSSITRVTNSDLDNSSPATSSALVVLNNHSVA